MGVIERVTRAIAVGDTAFTQMGLEDEAWRLLGVEIPWPTTHDVERVVDHVIGLGPIQPLLDDVQVSDILVNGPANVWVDRGSGLEPAPCRFGSDEELVTTIERAIAPLGLRIDRASPMVDARLPDGSRLHAVLPPAAVEHPLLAIRRFTQRVGELEDLVSAGTATQVQIELLVAAVRERRTVLVSGGTGAGKTTLLNLMAGQIAVSERIVTIEDAAELDLPGHVVRLEARPANAEGAGEITIRSLIKSALRLRPDRIIVGEVRGPEALDLISAMNTGHRGSLTTVHANSPREALLRLETLALSAGDASESAIARQLDAAVEMVVQIDRIGSERRISDIVDIEDLRGWSG